MQYLFSLSSSKPLVHRYPDCMDHCHGLSTCPAGNKLSSSTLPPSAFPAPWALLALRNLSPAIISLCCPTLFFVPFVSGSLLFLLCVRLLLTGLLNPSLKFIFPQWSNFFTHHISIGYKRSGYFAKNCDIFLRPIFSSLSVQKLNSPQHGGQGCDRAVTN